MPNIKPNIMKSTKTWALTVISIAAGMLLALDARAGEITLTADRDNTLYESETGGDSNGAGIHFFAGLTNEGLLRRGVIHFDLSTVPPGSTIDSAVLTLNMSMTVAGPASVSLHRLTADWGEGTSDAPGGEGGGDASTPGDATWIHTFFDTEFWGSDGGDFDGSASATESVGSEGSYSWGSTAAMVADVQDWLDTPGDNFGWLVMGEEASRGKGIGTAKRFDTREIDADGPLGPQLVIQFTPPVPVDLLRVDVD